MSRIRTCARLVCAISDDEEWVEAAAVGLLMDYLGIGPRRRLDIAWRIPRRTIGFGSAYAIAQLGHSAVIKCSWTFPSKR